MTTFSLKNINFMSGSQYEALTEHDNNQLYAVETDLNTKANVDLNNLSQAGTKACAHCAMPGKRHDILTIGTSGTIYTAPANGYFYFTAMTTANNGYTQLISSEGLGTLGTRGSSGSGFCGNLPVKNGSHCTLQYNNCTIQNFIFIYAEGEN